MTSEIMGNNGRPPPLIDEFRRQYLDSLIVSNDVTTYPKGLGLYYTRFNKHRYTKRRERTVNGKRNLYRVLDIKSIYDMAYRDYMFEITWVALGTVWFEKGKDLRKINTVETIRKVAEAYSKYTNVFLWGYPQPDSIDEFVSYMHDCTDVNHVKGWLIDPEIGFKGEPKKASDLVYKCRDIDPYMILGMTTYGAAHWHKDFPYESFKDVDFASPQVYNFSEKLKRDSFREYDKIFKKVIPSTALFHKGPSGKFVRTTQELLRKEFDTTFKASDKEIDSVIMWQDAFHDSVKKQIIQEYGTKIRTVGVEK